MLSEQVYQAETHKTQREALILDHLELVRHVLGRLVADMPAQIDRENLEAAGVLGLVEAAQQFDPLRGVTFKTFAYPRIRGAILDELRRNSPLPQRMLRRIARIRRLCQTLDGPVTPEIISQRTGMSCQEVDEALDAVRLRNIQLSDRTPVRLEGLQDGQQPSPSAQLEQQELLDAMTAAVERLPEQERLAVTLYHLEGLRLREIGQLLDLSESRVSRVLARAEFRLSQLLRSSRA